MTRQHNRSRGYSVVEMSVAVLLFALALTYTLGVGSNLVSKWKLEKSANDIAGALRAARSRSIFNAANSAVDFAPDTGRFTVSSRLFSGRVDRHPTDPTRRIAQLTTGVYFMRPGQPIPVVGDPQGSLTVRPIHFNHDGSTDPDPTAVFNPRGLLVGTIVPGTVYIGHPASNSYRRIVVNAIGLVKVERWIGGTQWENI